MIKWSLRNTMNNDNRRTHPRFSLRAFAELANSEKEWAAHVLDISYQGARIALLDDYHLCEGDTIRLRLEIPKAQAPEGVLPYLYLNGTLVHKQEHILGIQYEPASAQDAELLNILLANLHN
jgi:hypothetical protein